MGGEHLERRGEPADLNRQHHGGVEVLGLREQHGEADAGEAVGEAHDALIVGGGGVGAEHNDEAGRRAVTCRESQHSSAARGIVGGTGRGIAGEPRDGAAGDAEHGVGGERGRARPVVCGRQRGDKGQQHHEPREGAHSPTDGPGVGASRVEAARMDAMWDEAAHDGMVRAGGGRVVERAFVVGLYCVAAGLVGVNHRWHGLSSSASRRRTGG